MYKSAVLWIKKDLSQREYFTVRTADGKFINLKPNPEKKPGDKKPDYVEFEKANEKVNQTT